MKQNTTLPTQLQAGLRRWERPLKEAAKRAAWAQRLDPAQYACRKVGRTWIAECESAGQLFSYERTPESNVECRSHSGATYLLTPDGDGGWCCTCPAAATTPGPCKHSQGLRAVFAAHLRQQLAQVQAPAAVALGSEEEDAATHQALEAQAA